MNKSKRWLTIEVIAAIVLLILSSTFIKRKIDDYRYIGYANYQIFGGMFSTSRENTNFTDQKFQNFRSTNRQAKALFNSLVKYKDTRFYELIQGIYSKQEVPDKKTKIIKT